MTLRKLSDKEIKTINGGTGTGYPFPITTFLAVGILDTLGNIKALAGYAVGATLGLLGF